MHIHNITWSQKLEHARAEFGFSKRVRATHHGTLPFGLNQTQASKAQHISGCSKQAGQKVDVWGPTWWCTPLAMLFSSCRPPALPTWTVFKWMAYHAQWAHWIAETLSAIMQWWEQSLVKPRILKPHPCSQRTSATEEVERQCTLMR